MNPHHGERSWHPRIVVRLILEEITDERYKLPHVCITRYKHSSRYAFFSWAQTRFLSYTFVFRTFLPELPIGFQIHFQIIS